WPYTFAAAAATTQNHQAQRNFLVRLKNPGLPEFCCCTRYRTAWSLWRIGTNKKNASQRPKTESTADCADYTDRICVIRVIRGYRTRSWPQVHFAVMRNSLIPLAVALGSCRRAGVNITPSSRRSSSREGEP